ncbi:MAG: glycosyltransferase [Deltaproteobacteria bacterium]|nr:MAG: glycosyltransferase [Deltaproteobacteria bacterium]
MLAYEENPDKVERADLVVGIPSHNEAKNIGHSTAQAAKGLLDHFGGRNSVIINCDNHSEDGTKEVFLQTTSEVPKVYLSTPPGIVGRGYNLKNLIAKAVELQAQAVIVVSGDLNGITPLWIKNLGEPIFAGFGFVAPLYLQHKYEGAVGNSIVYPLTRALYGRRVRQPIGGDCAFAANLAETYLTHPTWNDTVAQCGVDIWMTTLAIYQGIPICQSFVGRPKNHQNDGPFVPPEPAFTHTVGTLLDLMMLFQDFWGRVKWSKPTAIYGFGVGEVETPAPIEVSEDELHQGFVQCFDRYQQLWETVLENNIYNKLGEIRELPMAHFSFPSELWARILFTYSVAYKKEVADRQELLKSLLPLFLGKTLSFVKKTERMSIQQAEEYIENECMIFEETKPYLLGKWGNLS